MLDYFQNFCFLNQSVKESMNVMEVKQVEKLKDIICSMEIPIIKLITYEIESFVMGYHVYKSRWTPSIGDEFYGFMEPTNNLDKYAVAVKKSDGEIIGHLPLGKSGRFAKVIFYFLKNDSVNVCKITVTGKSVNLGDGLGMRVPCKLSFFSEKASIKILQEQLPKLL